MFKQTPPITKNLIIINCLMYAAQYVFRQRGIDITDYMGLHYVLAPDFGIYQLATYMFLHGNLTHLLFNMFSLWMFGRIIEQVQGPRRFLLYYFVCGVGAGICQELWQTGEYVFTGLAAWDGLVNTGYGLMTKAQFLNLWTTIGASGACYGILLAYGMTFPNERIMLLIPPIPMKAKYFVAAYAAIELFAAFSSNGNIAHFAHLGGMLFGLLLLLHWRRTDYRSFGMRSGKPSLWKQICGKWKQMFGQRTKMDVKWGERNFKDRAGDYDFNADRRKREERVDAILDKIRKSGYENLTDEEKKELFTNSRK